MWLLPERADLSFAVKELARHVQAPGEGHWADLKRVLRYVKGPRRLGHVPAHRRERFGQRD
eukprot:11711132-Heterocapsa_arctica.AAC.1